MISRTHRWRVLLVAFIALLVASAALVVRGWIFKPVTITALFTSATSIYPGDEVRVAGVKVGTIEAIDPQQDHVRLTLTVDNDVPVPADAQAVIVAQNLVAARYVQLTPAYETAAVSGPEIADGAVIGVDRTAVPVEWDEVKTQLTRLATELGGTEDSADGVSSTSVGRFIDTTAEALQGNGEKLRTAISQLSRAGRILADGSGDIVTVIKNLQIFIGALRDSNVQIVQFQDRLATVTSTLDASRTDLDAALTNLSEALGDVKRFIADSRDATAEQIQRLGNVTQVLVDNQLKVENILHVTPNAIANGYNVYSPDTGTFVGAFALNNFSNPLQTICGTIGALKNVTSAETAKLCSQYLGPASKLLNFNYLPLPFNAYLSKSPSPGNLIYTDPALAPGGAGTSPPQPIADLGTSAYTGGGDVPPPIAPTGPAPPPGIYAPGGLPAIPSPALFPNAPIPVTSAPNSLQDMLLPAEVPTPSTSTTSGNPPS